MSCCRKGHEARKEISPKKRDVCTWRTHECHFQDRIVKVIWRLKTQGVTGTLEGRVGSNFEEGKGVRDTVGFDNGNIGRDGQ